MIRTAFISSLALSLCLVAGCDKEPAGTTPPKDGETADAGKGGKGGKGDKGNKGDKGDKGSEEPVDENDPTKKVCPAEVGEYPAPYFGDTVLLRLPKGVTEDNFVEMQPGFVRASPEIESVSCIEGIPGGVISFMALSSFMEEKDKTMAVYKDETLEAFGYLGVKISEEQIDEGKRFYQAVLDVPPAPDQGKPEPARALFKMQAANDMVYAIVYETHPNAWNALKETFMESANRMSFLAPQ